MLDDVKVFVKMIRGLLQSVDWIKKCSRRFRSDESGNIVVLFVLSSVGIFSGLAASIDLASAYAARQRLSEVAALTCQYSTRSSVAQTATASYSGANGFQTYVAAVNAFATTSLAAQHWQGTMPTGGSATPTSYFTATPAVGGTSASANGPTNPVVEMTASIPTRFSAIFNINSIPVHTKIACQTLANVRQIVHPPTILQEGFEAPCATYCTYNPSGGRSTISSPTNTFPTGVGYTGYGGFKWYIVGYCLEVDYVGRVNPTVPEGTNAAELDCDNGSYSAGNSSISSSVYLEAGQYELRYNYRSRIDYPDYDPTYICGSTASDVSWASDTASVGGSGSPALRTNQINVYLDANITGTNGTVGSAPLHKTLDGTQYLAGSNLIDMCVYSPTWIERSIKIKVSNPGFYWLSFAADGANDSFGGQLDNIRMCQELCPGSLQDNFPTSWLAANNSGVNKVLFEDTFESPTYTGDASTSMAYNGNLNSSTGTSSLSACGNAYQSPPGWPCQPVTGWATAPYNQINYVTQGAAQGSQYIALDGDNATGNNRLISRPFLLDPGFYNLNYYYISGVDFSASNIYGTYCFAAPGSGAIYPAATSSKSGYIRFYKSSTKNADTNIMGVFMSHSQLVNTPITGGALGSATSYSNPDGSTTASPTAPPDAVTWSNYDATAVNPVLDTCGYADSFRWIPRSVSIKITKPGFYWLTFSANGGTADGVGGGIDDVKLTALGSPYMSNPPTSPLVAIPVPSPQPDASYAPGTYAGFTIVADPFTPPAADP